MPAQLATRPVFWAPAHPGVGRRPPGRAPGRAARATRPPGHQGAHQVTRATGPGTRSTATRSTATRSTATRSASPGTRSRHRAPGRADHGHQGAAGEPRHQVGGRPVHDTRATFHASSGRDHGASLGGRQVDGLPGETGRVICPVGAIPGAKKPGARPGLS